MVLVKKYYLVSLFVLFLIISAYFYDHLTLETIKDNKLWISDFIAHHYSLSVFLFFLSCLVFINSPIPLAAIIKVLGGFTFGFYMGSFYNISATILACLAGFGISRYALKEAFEKAYYDRVKKVEDDIEKNGFYYFLTLRLVMVVPYFIINITAGISRVSFKHYLFSTLLGVIPTSLIYANAGSRLEQINSVAELLEPEFIVAVLLIALASVIPPWLKKTRTTPNIP